MKFVVYLGMFDILISSIIPPVILSLDPVLPPIHIS
nr:MAG TPA: hypothetical protein [Caudoviricetes sp.]DAS65833.1 MAG TPA: hypothetical protein [Caudoviricetes sp.]